MISNNNNIKIGVTVDDKTTSGVNSAKNSINSIPDAAKQAGKSIEDGLSEGAKGASTKMESTFGNFINKLKTQMVPAVVGAMKSLFDGLAAGIDQGFNLASKRAENTERLLNQLEARHQNFLKGGDVTVEQIQQNIDNLEKAFNELKKAEADVAEIGEGYGFAGRTMRKRNKAAASAISDESKGLLSALGVLGAGNTTTGDIKIIRDQIAVVEDEIQHARKQLADKQKGEDSGLLPPTPDLEAEARKKAEAAWAAYKEQLGIEAANVSADDIVAKMFPSAKGKFGPESTADPEDLSDAVPQMTADEVAAFEKKYKTGSHLYDEDNPFDNGDLPDEVKKVLAIANQIGEISNQVSDMISGIFEGMRDEVLQSLELISEEISDSEERIGEYKDSISSYEEKLAEASGADAEYLISNLNASKMAMAEEQAALQEKQEKEKQLKQKAADLDYKQKKAEGVNNIIQSIIAGSLAASNALYQTPYPANLVFSAIVAALGVANTAVISANVAKIKPVKYANGGLLDGPSHANGGIPVGNTGVEVEGGEYVVNKRATAQYLPLLNAINGYGHSDHKFANGGALPDVNYSQPEIIVTVKDINAVSSRVARVRDL